MDESPIPSRSALRGGRASRQLLFWIVALSGAIPYIFARELMNPMLGWVVLAHVGGGILLTPLAGLLIRDLRAPNARSRDLLTSGTHHAVSRAGILLSLVVSSSGFALACVAASGGSVSHWHGTFVIHASMGFTALAACVGLAATRVRARFRASRTAASVTIAAAIAILGAGALAATSYGADTYFRALTAASPSQARNPLFPAGTRMNGADSWESATRRNACGSTGCHPEIAKQWTRSGHAHAFIRDSYQSALRTSKDRIGTVGVRWCAGCHNPISFASSNPGSQAHDSYDRTIGGGPTSSGDRTGPSESESVGCLSCHAMHDVADATGNGRAGYSAPPVYPFGDGGGAMRWAHDFLIRVRPAPHVAGFSGPKAGTPSAGPDAMCVPCHRLSVTPTQNGYKFLRYDNTWSDWQASGFSGESAHAFTTPPLPSTCVSCHMRERPGSGGPTVHDHSILTADLANRESWEDIRRKRALSVEIFALRRTESGGLPRLYAPLTHSPVLLIPGEDVTIDVLVENRSIGHSFPTGMPSMRACWLELTATYGTGSNLRLSPAAPNVGAHSNPVTRLSGFHPYGLLAIDRAGKPVGPNDFSAMVAPIAMRSLVAGEGEVVRFTFRPAAGIQGPVTFNAALKYSTEPSTAVYLDGNPATPDRPAMTLAEHSLTVGTRSTGPGGGSRLRTDDSSDAPRFFAYGIALLRPDAEPPQLAQARSAFQQAIQWSPRIPGYWVALGRTYLAEGDLLSARAALEHALRIDPRATGASAWLGSTFLRMGQYEKALSVLNPLAERFPRDRQLWQDIGLCYVKSAKYEAAALSFNRVLAVDPDDASAHYNLMRCYTALNRLTEGRQEEAIFHALQDDTPLTSLVEPYFQAHPRIRTESVPTHTHALGAAP